MECLVLVDSVLVSDCDIDREVVGNDEGHLSVGVGDIVEHVGGTAGSIDDLGLCVDEGLVDVSVAGTALVLDRDGDHPSIDENDVEVILVCIDGCDSEVCLVLSVVCMDVVVSCREVHGVLSIGVCDCLHGCSICLDELDDCTCSGGSGDLVCGLCGHCGSKDSEDDFGSIGSVDGVEGLLGGVGLGEVSHSHCVDCVGVVSCVDGQGEARNGSDIGCKGLGHDDG